LAGRVRLLDYAVGRSQFAMLWRRPLVGGDHADHPKTASAHDDVACAIAGAIAQVMDAVQEQAIPMGGMIIYADGTTSGPPTDSRLPANYRTFSGAEQSDVEKAKAVIVDLERKREVCVRRGSELADQRANVALAAHTGDQKAAKKLEQIHQAIIVHDGELASIDAALKAAGDRLAAMERMAGLGAERERALS
jgi:hypothetical protein